MSIYMWIVVAENIGERGRTSFSFVSHTIEIFEGII